uniref:Uncharacterized protein n=1 Tax=Timema bartmani TaxID=61472 RepID=A0A7R9I1U2_9NEOP|nr:unnamed protein product [Timema bartmani]
MSNKCKSKCKWAERVESFQGTAGHSIPHNYPFIVYLSTKHAITALTTGLRREITDLGSHIKVTIVSMTTNSKVYRREYKSWRLFYWLVTGQTT